MSPIRARSRRPTGVATSMSSSSRRASSGASTGVRPRFTTVARAAHRGGRVDRHHLAGHQPVEQVADRGQALLDGRRGELARLRLDPGRDVQRPHGSERRHAMRLAPGEELGHGAAVGAAGVRVADRGGEELEEAQPARSPAAVTSAGRTVDAAVWTSWFISAVGGGSGIQLRPFEQLLDLLNVAASASTSPTFSRTFRPCRACSHAPIRAVAAERPSSQPVRTEARLRIRSALQGAVTALPILQRPMSRFTTRCSRLIHLGHERRP